MQILDLDLTELAALIATGEISSREATKRSLDALETIGRDLNCTVSTYADEAMASAAKADQDLSRGLNHGRLHGVPMAHKDLFEVAGRLVAAGSKVRRDHRATRTASTMRRLAEAGAIHIGALHMSEFALSPTGYNGHLGYCRNPWNRDFITGGSSSGSAAAVAARLIPGSLGSDTGGSVRIPAGACGITGVKPTYSLIAKDGVTPLSPSLDCVGPLARTAADCALLLDVIAGPDASDPLTSHAPRVSYTAALGNGGLDLSIGVLPRRDLEGVDHEVLAILQDGIANFQNLGAKIVEADISSFEVINELNRAVLVIEAAALHRRQLVDNPQDFSPHVRGRLETGLYLPATRYFEAMSMRGKLAARFVEQTFASVDLLLLPCIPFPVPPISMETDGVSGTVTDDIVKFTRAINYLGIPAASVPAGFTANGLPASFQLVGRHFDETRILAVAHAYQQTTDWHRRRPAIV